MSRRTALLWTFGTLALASLASSNLAFGEATLRTAACSTLSQVTYNGRDYTIRNYALRHNLEWKNPNEELDLQLHEQLSDTFPPFATVVRNLVREAKEQDGRVLSGSESAQVLGLYGTDPGPVVFPSRDFTYEWMSPGVGIRTDEVSGKVVGRYRVSKRAISDDVELIQQVLVEAPNNGGILTQSEETSCFRFKQPRWMWSQLVPAPIEMAAAAFDPLIYAVDNSWNQLKDCRAAKGSCEPLHKLYLRAVEARDKGWKDASTIQQLPDSGRKAGARGFAFATFPEDVQVDEQGWLVLEQGSGYLNHLGEKTDGQNLRAPGEAVQKILEQQQLLAADAAAKAQGEPSSAEPEVSQAVASEGRTSVPPPARPKAARDRVGAEASAGATPKVRSAARSEVKTAKHVVHAPLAVARAQPGERTQPSLRATSIPLPLRRGSPLGPPPRYEARIRRDVSPFFFLFED
jgi:hypothetical protein